MCVWGSLSVGLVGCGAVGAPGWAVLGLHAGGRVWTRRVAFGVVDTGRRRGLGLGLFVGAWCRMVARAGRLWLPYSCGWACFPSRQVMPGVPGFLWPRGLRQVSLCCLFGCTFLPGALLRAGPRWCRSARSPCGFGGLRPVC